jgi:hypothetical protein
LPAATISTSLSLLAGRSAPRRPAMRAEAQKLNDSIKESLALLRRYL